ncbi:MAG TPA: murein biosynthesis integral membrane protein MurJ [Acetobacteraceae bacterium]|jgi:putative peptidoglycan lipid II flippase|nr:murein biosynthesis integral membrane protein MurJ [Acetobacteraceae bacterium]
MLRGILTVGAWTMGSRVLGFARDMLIAALLGDGPIADAFFVALKLPNLFRRLFGEGAFNAAFVPAVSGMLATEGRPPAERFASEAFATMTLGLGVLVLVGELFMPWLVRLLAPGFAEEPSKFALTVALCRITYPYLLLICLAALVSGVLNGMDRYAAAAGSAMLFNVGAIAAMIWLPPFVPTVGHALSWGVMLSGIAQLGLVLAALRRTGFRLRPRGPLLSPQIKLLLRRMAPGLLGAGVTQLNVVVDGIIASLLPPGSVSLLYYADRVQQLPLGVIGAAVGTAMLPLLSRQVRAGEAEAAAGTANRAMEYALVLTLPSALALIVLREPVIAVLFGRGAFDSPEGITASAGALAGFAVGLPAYVLIRALAPCFFARGDTATPVKVGLVAVALNLVLNVLFMRPLQQVGPALATSLAAICNVVLLGWVLRARGHLRLDARLRARLPRMAIASVAMAAVLWGARATVFAALDGPGFLRWLGLALVIVIGMLSYAAAGQAIGAFALREFAGALLRRRRPALAKSG